MIMLSYQSVAAVLLEMIPYSSDAYLVGHFEIYSVILQAEKQGNRDSNFEQSMIFLFGQFPKVLFSI